MEPCLTLAAPGGPASHRSCTLSLCRRRQMEMKKADDIGCCGSRQSWTRGSSHGDKPEVSLSAPATVSNPVKDNTKNSMRLQLTQREMSSITITGYRSARKLYWR